MNISETDIEKAGLLHDIGKVYQRAERVHKNHSFIGQEKMAPYLQGKNDAILRAIANHHRVELEQNDIADNDISYIIYEADNLAASSDRRSLELEGVDSAKSTQNVFVPTIVLGNVWNIFDNKGTLSESAYPLRGIGEEKRMPYPVEWARIQAPAEKYKRIVREVDRVFRQQSPLDMTVHELLHLMEATMSYIPSSTNMSEVPDISLYDHQKLTAAFAGCIYLFFEAQDITDYKTYCYGNKNAAMRKSPMYLIVSGDMSGIQNFIYTIPSKGALKSLRGRSLYLDVLLENIIDEILKACGVSRTCLIYSGGGHFYMLLPNTQQVKKVLDTYRYRLNDWFLTHYGKRLYMALAAVPCTAKDLTKGNGRIREVFRSASQELSKAKLNRYESKQLADLFDPNSAVNRIADGNRECAVCHTSSVKLFPYGDEGEEDACEACNSLYQLGTQALKKSVFYVTDRALKGAVPIPGYEKDLYLKAVEEANLSDLPSPERLYIKNDITLGKEVATYLWMGDYYTKGTDGQVIEFTELAQRSGGNEKDSSIARIGVLRADVDNLGAAFIAGFNAQYDTLTRKAVLSRNLSMFFKRYINDICRGYTVDGTSKFTLFTDKKQVERQLHIIYSGGDDMFLAGTWDDIIEIAIDLRHAFERFTNGKLTFSAGIGFFHPKCPISQMARKTGELETYAKDNPDKNSIALFGEVVKYKERYEEMLTTRYTWDDFEYGVCGEKLNFLQQHFEWREDTSQTKLIIVKGVLYRLLDLMRGTEREENRINLARFAYTLARMEPKKAECAKKQCYEEVKNQLYIWYQNEQSCQQMMTAIELLIYRLRDKGVKNE